MSQGFNVFLPEDFEPFIDNIAKETNSDKDDVVKTLFAIGLFLQKKVSIGTAAKLSGRSFHEFYHFLEENDIPWHAIRNIAFEIEEIMQEIVHEKGYQYTMDSILHIQIDDFCYEYVIGPDEYADEIILWADAPDLYEKTKSQYLAFLDEIIEKLKLIKTKKPIKVILEPSNEVYFDSHNSK